jgi:serine phosphatase RsbU (regulator of sigma subunit)
MVDRSGHEETLAEREARLRALFAAIDEGYCLCDIILDEAGEPADYRFLEINGRFEEMTGLHDAVGRTIRELEPAIEAAWIENCGRVALGGSALRWEDRSDALGRWFDVFATPVEPRGRFAVVFTDVSARKRAEAVLRERELSARRTGRQAELLGDIAADLDAAHSHEAAVQRLLDRLVPAVADAATIEAPDEPDSLVAAIGSGARAGNGRPHSTLAVPIELGGARPATLLLGRSHPSRPAFTEDDEAFVRRIADRAGLILVRERAHEVEHAVSLRLQQALLPDALVRLPGVELAARYEASSAALEVGGDWYDSYALDGDRVGLVVGDVMGHGLEAAAAMGRLRVALAALVPHADGPAQLLEHLDAFNAGPDGADFATACYAELDLRTGRLRHSSAGHPPGLVVPQHGEPRWLEGGRSMALCRMPVAVRPEATCELEPGTLLVLCSDGLVERRGELIDAGLERLRRAAADARDAPLPEICDRIVAELGVATMRDDDVVLLCARRVHATL